METKEAITKKINDINCKIDALEKQISKLSKSREDYAYKLKQAEFKNFHDFCRNILPNKYFAYEYINEEFINRYFMYFDGTIKAGDDNEDEMADSDEYIAENFHMVSLTYENNGSNPGKLITYTFDSCSSQRITADFESEGGWLKFTNLKEITKEEFEQAKLKINEMLC